jgi:hypothetical protein
MNWTSLLLSSAVAVSASGEALAFKSAVDSIGQNSHANQLALNPSAANPSKPVNSAPAKPAGSSATPAETSAELQKLEKRFFMHDFSQEPIEQRLTRMEKFSLGAVNTGTPESRVARLAAILDTHDADTPLASMAGVNPAPAGAAGRTSAPPKKSAPASDSDDSDDSDASDNTDYPHVTYLEDAILGQDYPGQPIEKRLARLETKAFGAPSADPDLSNRTDALERYSETKLHKKPFDDHPVDRPVRADRPALTFSDLALDNFGDPSGLKEAPPAPPPVDPLALMSTPPPESARLLSRVAWCEQHVLGRTYPEMHLLPRLHQLNATLFPKDKTKDIQLMDHVDAIVKEVVLRQHPPTGKQTT